MNEKCPSDLCAVHTSSLAHPCWDYCSITISGISWKFRPLCSSLTGLWLTSSASVPKIFLYADCVCPIFQRNCIFYKSHAEETSYRRDKNTFFHWVLIFNVHISAAFLSLNHCHRCSRRNTVVFYCIFCAVKNHS